jgi:hypothetical protein
MFHRMLEFHQFISLTAGSRITVFPSSRRSGSLAIMQHHLDGY